MIEYLKSSRYAENNVDFFVLGGVQPSVMASLIFINSSLRALILEVASLVKVFVEREECGWTISIKISSQLESIHFLRSRPLGWFFAELV